MHKKYALACKLYEYLFEPVLADKSYVFYQIGFHRFISMLVYLELRIRERNAERLFEDFEQLMRSKNIAGMSFLFGPSPAVLNPNLKAHLEDAMHANEIDDETVSERIALIDIDRCSLALKPILPPEIYTPLEESEFGCVRSVLNTTSFFASPRSSFDAI